MNRQQEPVISINTCKIILLQILRHFHIIEFNLSKKPSPSDSYLGNYSVLTIKVESYGSEKVLNFYVKTLKLTNPIMARSRRYVDVFQKEVFIYNILLRDFCRIYTDYDGSFLPKFYYGRDDVLILENLGAAGFAPAKVANFNDDHLRLTLRTLAKFHSLSLGLEENKSSEGSKWRLIDAYQDVLKEAAFRSEKDFWGFMATTKSVEAIKFIHSNICSDESSNAAFDGCLDRFVKDFWNIFINPPSMRCVCCHGDVWANNLIFKYEDLEPVACKLVNFQGQRYAPPAHDVTFLLTHTTSREARKVVKQEYYLFYYECLEEELSNLGLDIDEIIPYDEYHESLQVYEPIAVAIRAFHATVNSVSKDCQQIYFKSEQKLFEYILHDRMTLLREIVKLDPGFTKRMTGQINDLKDVLTQWSEPDTTTKDEDL